MPRTASQMGSLKSSPSTRTVKNAVMDPLRKCYSMKAFQFRLASVVRIREMQLRREESTLEQLFAEKTRIQTDLENLQQSVSESWNASKTRSTLLSPDLSAISALAEHSRREGARFR